jgi:hypothetical protein
MANTAKVFGLPPPSLPACHPANITSKAGTEFEDDGLVQSMAGTLGKMDSAWKGILNARTKQLADPMKTRMAALSEIHKYAWGAADACNKQADTTLAKARAEVQRIEESMTSPLKLAAGKPLAAEVRSHLKSLDDGARSDLLIEAIAEGDAFTVGAALGAPAYLSGLRPEVHAMLVNKWRLARHPKDTARIKVINEAIEHITRGSHELMTQIQTLSIRPN